MPDDNTNDGSTNDQNAGADQTGDQNTGDQSNSGNDYPEGLGDAGKRAIDRMKQERDEARRLLREAQASQNTQTQNTDTSDRNGRKDDDNKGKSAEDVENEIIARLTAQALRSSVREVAGAKLNDPNDALVLGNWSDMTPNEYGEFDRSAITSKIDDLIKSKPYLAKSDKKFEGSAEGGNRGDNTIQGQVSRDQLKSMTPAEINKARADGRLRDVLSGK
jgi:hypothetical protein